MRRCVGAQVGRAMRLGVAVFGCATLIGCAASDNLAGKVDPRYGVTASPRVVQFGEPVPKGGGTYRLGRPYMVAGRMYVPEENRNYRAEGLASWYGADFHGRLTANGEIYDMEAISAAHPTLPMPSYVRVTNLANQKSLVVRVNDRGPYHQNREIDLSGRAAQLLGFRQMGIARVRVEYVGPAPIEGSDDRKLMATLREGQPAPAPAVMVASARPFLPRGSDTPIPPERPFDLGLSGPDTARRGQAAAGLPGVAYADLKPLRAEAAAPTARLPAPIASPAPVFGYAPSGSVGTQAVTSGRGLY